jgi:hypothetical protein
LDCSSPDYRNYAIPICLQELGGYNAAVGVANGSTDPVDKLIANNSCDICSPFSYANSIMGDPKQRKNHIKDAIDFRRAPGELEARSLRGNAREHPRQPQGQPGAI